MAVRRVHMQRDKRLVSIARVEPSFQDLEVQRLAADIAKEGMTLLGSRGRSRGPTPQARRWECALRRRWRPAGTYWRAGGGMHVEAAKKRRRALEALNVKR